ncbi:purine-nucleoside phosphorylase [Rubrimonas cliftonensis]|uniref:Purine nucleoside phosphorylase n=1 Tax=Rubrimonas cliftonensis TaxID=89524 RepID=A0A1H4AL17_9RHOB|nr:purine-nucleoside phosphorylase [Rubrimonas cliftonensis]SEA36468.1 purine-nucleoside phosphorylase [Rubrimonas cliftonensis]
MSAAAIIRDRAGAEPVALAVVLGSGLGGLAERVEEAVRIPYAELPGFPAAGVSGHAGALVVGRLSGARVALLAGRAHYYETGDAAAMRGAIETLAALEVGALLLTNAAGSTRPAMPPGALMAISDHIAWSGRNPLIGDASDARFCDMTDAYDPSLRARLKALDPELHEGVYAWFSGPSFETPAEIRAVAMLGADAVGMSTAPETILARRCGLRVAGVSVITNFAAGMSATALTHAQTKAEADRASARFERLVAAFAEGFA